MKSKINNIAALIAMLYADGFGLPGLGYGDDDEDHGSEIKKDPSDPVQAEKIRKAEEKRRKRAAKRNNA